MLTTASGLKGYKLNGNDGELGEVDEFYFDDEHWTVRYVVANTGTWLVGRMVLISPYALNGVIHNGRILSVDLTLKQIKNSPSLDSHKPISRQFEKAYHRYYGWPQYWNGPHTWGSQSRLVRDRELQVSSASSAKEWDPHLRSTKEVIGNHIQALDGEIGHVEDFVLDEASWSIRYLIVGTRNWWPGKKVLVAPQWIHRVSWAESKVFINLSQDTIQESPAFTADASLSRDYEISLHNHYNRKGYWVHEPAYV